MFNVLWYESAKTVSFISDMENGSPLILNGCEAVSAAQLHQNGNVATNGNSVAVASDDLHESANDVSALQQMSSRDREVVRIVGQYLRDLGFKATYERLIAESGCELENSTIAQFRSLVLFGDWESAEASLEELRPLLLLGNESTITEMRFALREQRYLELLEDGEYMQALSCLRELITPLKHNTERVHQLSTFIMCSGLEELAEMSGWRGRGAGTRQRLLERLQAHFPADVMLPPRRLQGLLVQASELQVLRCRYHNTALSADSISLLSEHSCQPERTFPTTCCQVVSEVHNNEVWVCRFSEDGLRLATGTKDSWVMLWDVDASTHRVSLLHRLFLGEEKGGVSVVAWSPDSTLLIACGNEEAAELIVFDVAAGVPRQKLQHAPEDMLTAAAWYPDSRHYVCGGERGQFYLVDVENQEDPVQKVWECIRVKSLVCHAAENGEVAVLASDTLYRLRKYNFRDNVDTTLLREGAAIMAFTLSSCGRYAALNVVGSVSLTAIVVCLCQTP